MKFKLNDITNVPEIPLSELAKANVINKSFLLAGGEEYPVQKMLWADGLTPQVVEAHFQKQKTPDIFVYTIPNARVFGPNLIGNADWDVYFSNQLYPEWMRAYITDGHAKIGKTSDPSTLKSHTISAPCMAVLNFQYHAYGHFLLEMLPKLLTFRLLADYGFEPRVVIPQDTPQYIRKMMCAVVPSITFVEYDVATEYLIIEKLFLPAWMATAYLHHSYVISTLRDFAIKQVLTHRDGPKKLFIARPKKQLVRYMENHEEVEQLAKTLGFVVIRPDMIEWKKQISLFYQAEIIVGEYGSAMHNTIFSRPGTKVITINWMNALQSAIAHSCGHKLGYILPDDAKPKMYYYNQMDMQSFHLDTANFEHRLRMQVI
ncbi:MAG: DUF563 domain-containing protein [Hyphomicrobiales bacterium]|nr:DUF563 domain-containing protein [Hyphomicrobiales bacterium]